MRKAIWAGALLATGVAVMGAGAREAKAETVVRIQDYPGLGNLLYRVAASKGFCAKHGIRCEMQPIPAAPLGMQALLAKSIDVALPPPEVAINAAIKGADIRVIGSGAQRNPFQVIVRPDLDVPDGNDDFKPMMLALKGRKIGVPARGAGGELLFVQLANLAGLKASDYTFVSVGAPNTSYGALKSKQIDASMTFEPSASICEVIKDCKAAYIGSRASGPKEITGTNGASTLLVVTKDMIDRSPDTVRAVVAAGNDAEAFMQDPANLKEVIAIAGQNSKINIPRGDEVLATSVTSRIPSFKMALSRPALKQVVANMIATGQLAKPFDTDGFVYDATVKPGGGQ